MVKDSRVKHRSSQRLKFDKVLRYANYGSLTAGGPVQVEGSMLNVMCVLRLIRAV